MRVLFMTNIPSPYRADFFNELGKLCDLTVAYEGLTSTERDKKWVGEKAEQYTPIILNGKRTKTDQFFCPGIIKVIKLKWDAIIVGNYSTPTSMLAISYMNLHKISFIIQADGGLIAENENKLKYKLKRHYISSATAWMSSGNTTTEYLAHYGALKGKIYVYPFTSLWENDLVQANKLRSQNIDELRKKLEIREDYIVLSVGRFSYDGGYGKGYDLLLKAAERLPKNIGIYIVGDDPTDEFIRWKEESKLINVHYVGFKIKEELRLYYAAADIFVLMTRADVWGLVINEAMSFGLPVITTDKCVAGLELVKDNENGFILSTDDLDGLVNSILYLVKDQERMWQFGNESLKRIQAYTIENMAKENARILDNTYREK